MYDQFYGFTGRPFQLTPDPNFYFESGTHRKAMSYLGYGLAQGEGFIVITGDVGAGKTTLVGHLMNTIDPSRLTAVKLVSTQVEGDDLLRLVAEQFGLDWERESKAELLRTIEQYLREQARAGRRTLLIVDEGQNLSISALEELRMLSNFQLGGHSLLQIFLLGQPEFRQTLFHSPSLEQLRQRVIATHHLDPMDPEEVEPYILHRLGKVGWSGNPSFSPDAFEAIFDYSEGVPRKLNVLVSRLLLFGAVEKLTRIAAQNVRAVVAEIDADCGIDQNIAGAAPSAAPIAIPEPAAPEIVEPEPVAAEASATPEPEVPIAARFAAMVDASAAPQAPAAAVKTDAAPDAQTSESTLSAPRTGSEFDEARSLIAAQLDRGGTIEPLPNGDGPHDTPSLSRFTPSFVSTDDHADEGELELTEILPATADEPAAPGNDAQLIALQRQIAGLEARIIEQDAALRRVIDLLIDWVERDPENAPDAAQSQTRAA